MRQYIKIKKYLLPISGIIKLEVPSFLPVQEFGITVYEYPRTIAFRGSSNVRLKCGEINGFRPSIVSLLYNLNELVQSLYFKGGSKNTMLKTL